LNFESYTTQVSGKSTALDKLFLSSHVVCFFPIQAAAIQLELRFQQIQHDRQVRSLDSVFVYVREAEARKLVIKKCFESPSQSMKLLLSCLLSLNQFGAKTSHFQDTCWPVVQADERTTKQCLKYQCTSKCLSSQTIAECNSWGVVELSNILLASVMDKLQLTGQNLGRVFNFRFGHLHAEHFWCYQVKLPNLKVENSAQTASRFSPVSYHAPRFSLSMVELISLSLSRTRVFYE